VRIGKAGRCGTAAMRAGQPAPTIQFTACANPDPFLAARWNAIRIQG
jgi:hypothetical protein